MWSFNAAGVTFSIDELGNPFFKGTIAASGFTSDEITIDEIGNVDSTGTFRFGGASSNFIDFNGTQLVIDTDNFSVDGAGNATFSGDITAATFTNDELSIDSDGNVDSTGTFRFGGASDNFIDFNGTQLVIDTPELSVDGSGNATFGGDLSAATGTFGDDSTDQFISYDGTTLTLGSGVTIGDNTDRTVTVGSGGDYATIDLALEALSRVVPAYKSGGFTATITPEAGYVDDGGIEIVGVDLSWITIKDIGSFDWDVSAGADYFMTLSEGAKGPKIDASITATQSSSGDASGFFYVDRGSFLEFKDRTSGAELFLDADGLINSSLIVADNGSTVIANGLRLLNNDAGMWGVSANSGSTVMFFNGEVTNAFAGGGACIAEYGAFIDCTLGYFTVKQPSLLALLGGKITFLSGTISTSGSDDEMKVSAGGMLVANGTAGTVSQTANTITSDGIIFR
jgi:hypothetical protein